MSTEHDHLPADAVGLDALFAAARAAEPPVPPDLLARVMADAVAVQPVAAAPQSARRRIPGRWLAEVFTLLGGHGAIAGLGAAGLAGFWIGFADPAGLTLLGEDDLSAEALAVVELYPADLESWSQTLALDLVPQDLP